MRQVNLMNLAASHIGTRNGCLSELSSYRRTHCMTGPAKSLDLLRKNLQNAINRDIDNVIKKYLEVWFLHLILASSIIIMVSFSEILSACYK